MDVDIPPRLDVKLTNLVEEGEFRTKEDALIQLARTGLKAYQTQPQEDDTPMHYDDLDESPTHDDEYVF